VYLCLIIYVSLENFGFIIFEGQAKTAYRITVRQLESIIRLSEALARLHLDNKVHAKCISSQYTCHYSITNKEKNSFHHLTIV
jgi:DNA replicative helicase MCM subunit Mcm2 (Cdc46/Mcm family)